MTGSKNQLNSKQQEIFLSLSAKLISAFLQMDVSEKERLGIFCSKLLHIVFA